MARLFEIRRSKIHGRGAFALTHIPKGTRLVEYTGEIITPGEADRRAERSRSERTYLFTINSRKLVDATHRGSRARYINHSCEPNCSSTVEKGRVWIDAERDIEPGEELTYDYQLIIDDSNWQKSGADYPCLCGKPKCRRTLLHVPKASWPKARAMFAPSRNGHKNGAKPSNGRKVR
jgi:SET domain-containing protein